MKAFWTIFFTVMFTVNTDGARGEEQKNVFASYSLSGSNDSFRLIKEVKKGEELLPGNYNIKAKISLKAEKRNIISDFLSFEPSEDTNSVNEQLPQGWTSSDKTYSWKPGNEENILTIPLSSKLTDKNSSITAFDELHLDYTDLTSENLSLLSLKMIISEKELEKDQSTVIIDGKQLMPLKSIDLPSILWQEKDSSYLTKRTLGLAHDSSWKFKKKNKYFFYQNRFHLNINTVETVDIQFKPNASLEKINSLSCNIRIGFESLLIPTKILECARFPKEIFRSNGNLVLRIWMGDLLRSKFIKKEKAFLDEIIFRISQKELTNIQEQPVASVQFRSLYQPEPPKKNAVKKDSKGLAIKDQVFRLQAPIIDLPSKGKRLVFPLNDLSDKIGRNGKIESIALSIQPEHWGSPAEFLLQRLRLVNHISEESPAMLNAGKSLSARWGGPFFNQVENSEKIEWIHVQDFFSFNGPNVNKGRYLTTYLKGERHEKSNLNATSDLIEMRGIRIHGQNGFHSWHAGENGLVLEGEGNWVELDWPIQTNFNPTTWFFMNFGKGKENILDLKITPLTEDLELPPISILPNKPERLNWKSEKVKRLKIKISFYSSPFRLQLKEMALFQPILPKPSKIFDIPILFEKETPLVPKNVQTVPPQKVTIFKGHLSAPSWPQNAGIPDALSWTTEVSRKINRIQGLKIMYKVPPTMHVTNPCWLHFTLVSTNHEINRSLCSEDSTNQIIFPTEKLFDDIEFDNNETLKHISWNILAKNQANLKTHPLPIDVAISLIGYDIRTFRNDLLSHPVMEWNGTTLFPTSLDGVSADDIFPHNFSTSLGAVSIKNKSKANPSFNFLEHPHLKINNIYLIKEEIISADEWVSLTKKEPEEVTPPGASEGTYHSNLILLSLLAGGLWLTWRHKRRLASLKWLIELSPELAEKQIRICCSIAAGSYLFGLIFALVKLRVVSDILLILASLTILLAWRSFTWHVRPKLEQRWPSFADKVYGGPGTHYIAGFLVTLVMAAFFLIIKLEPVAEQIAVVGYFMLVAGVVLEAWALRKKPAGDESYDSSTVVENEAPRA